MAGTVGVNVGDISARIAAVEDGSAGSLTVGDGSVVYPYYINQCLAFYDNSQA